MLRDTWGCGKIQTSPCRWLSTAPGELLDHPVAQQLAEAFPTQGFARHDTSQRIQGKRYQNFSRDVTPSGRGTAMASAGLPQLWAHLIGDLCSEDYLRRVAALLDQDMATAVEVRLVRHDPGDWLDPHTDGPEKLFSHIVYFNRDWRAEWGGCLEILAGADPASVVARVVPQLGVSALMSRTDQAWHQVTRVSDGIERTRMSLLVHGMR